MAGVQVAGFGVDLNLTDVYYVVLLLGIALTIFNLATAPENTNIFVGFQERVIGYPECKALVCLMPAQNSIVQVSQVFAGTWHATDLNSAISLQFAGFDVVKGLFGILISLTMVSTVIWKVYQWYFFTGVLKRPF